MISMVQANHHARTLAAHIQELREQHRAPDVIAAIEYISQMLVYGNERQQIQIATALQRAEVVK